MDSMYNENSQHAIELMDDDAVVWGIRSSPLTFAYENFLYDVVAHDCSQKNMNKQWYNNLAPDLKLFFMVKQGWFNYFLHIIVTHIEFWNSALPIELHMQLNHIGPFIRM